MAIPNKSPVKRVVLPFVQDHAQRTATLTQKLFKSRKKIRIERVDYINPTGLAGAAGNGFLGEIRNGATVVATIFNTNTSAGGATLTADTFITATLTATLANRIFALADIASLVLTLTGAATLPTGTVVIYYTELN